MPFVQQSCVRQTNCVLDAGAPWRYVANTMRRYDLMSNYFDRLFVFICSLWLSASDQTCVCSNKMPLPHEYDTLQYKKPSTARNQNGTNGQRILTKGCIAIGSSVFTARCYASAVLVRALCLCPCPCPSVTSRSSTKTAKRMITQTTPHDTTGTLVFWNQRSPRNSTGVTPCDCEGAKCRWGGLKSATFDK